MSKAFVDTTVLTDALLKRGDLRDRAFAALRRFGETQLPVYAIKEFKLGPLSAYRLLHNKFVVEGSLSRVVNYIQSLRLKRNMQSTMLEGIALLSAEIERLGLDDLKAKYGSRSIGQCESDEYRQGLKAIIYKAWRKRRRLTTQVVGHLSCYAEPDLREERGNIVMDPLDCTLEESCCMASAFRARLNDTTALQNALEPIVNLKAENARRYQALRHLTRTRRPLDRKNCRNLGDAVFAFFAPNDAVILTTNVSDHAPLAQALGKIVESP